jgi:mannose-1-phosphate guanylyltransferase
MVPTTTSPWAVLLAGGEGARLRPLTQRLTGDSRPKQFCPFFGSDTLLDLTRRRAEMVIRPDRQIVVVTAAHEPYWAPLVRELLPGRLLVQPDNRGTAPAILLGALTVRHLAGDTPIVVLPSDHDIGDERAFMQAVSQAVEAVADRRETIVLLGIEPRDAETEYGWIESRPGDDPVIAPIRRFWEKPSPAVARALLRRGCLWNSFVMVGRAGAFVDLAARTVPDLVLALAPVEAALGTRTEEVALARAYSSLPAVGFSEAVLAHAPDRLSVMRVKDVGWCDLGNPQRALEYARRRGDAPSWLAEAASLSA